MLRDPSSKNCAPEKRLVELNENYLVAHMQRSCGVKHKEDAYNSILLKMNIYSHYKYFNGLDLRF